jgi:hypothetical protein
MRRAKGVGLLLLGVLLAVAVAAPGPARAGKSPEGARHFTEGNDHYAAGRFEEAAAAFRRAYDVDRAPVLLYNAAKCLDRLGRFPAAVELMERYLAEEPDAPNRPAVEVELRLAEEKAGLVAARVTFESDPPGAELYLAAGAGPLGRTPLRAWLPYGEHVVTARLAGHLDQERRLAVGRGGPAAVRLVLVPAARAGRIELAGLPDGATVTLDGVEVGVTPGSAALSVRPGAHRVGASRDGVALLERDVTVGEGETVTLVAGVPPTGVPAEGGEPLVVAAPAADRDGFQVPWYGWTTIGLTVAGLGAGVACIVVAQDRHDQAADLAGRPGSDPDRVSALVDERDTLAAASYASFGVAGAAAIGTGLILWLSNTGSDGQGGGAGGPAVTLAPLQPRGGGGGLTVVGRF